MDPLQAVLDAQAPLHEALDPGEVPADGNLWATMGVLPEDLSSAPFAEPDTEGQILDLASDDADRAIFGALVSQ
jgi:hypothetical protein